MHARTTLILIFFSLSQLQLWSPGSVCSQFEYLGKEIYVKKFSQFKARKFSEHVAQGTKPESEY